MAPRVFLVAIVTLLSLFFTSQTAWAQASVSDSVRLPEVAVRASKYVLFGVGTRTQTLDTLLLQRQPGLTLADILQKRSPLYLKSYGNGMTATVAFRGTTASHTAVLWNGFNIALPTLGLTDFALLPPAPSTAIVLQHGPSGALHGNGAVGGSILLENNPVFRPRQQVQVQQEAGSFGHRRTAANATFSSQKIHSATSYTKTSSDNNFRFKNTTEFGQPWKTQENAAFDQTSLAQDIHVKLNPEHRISLRGWYVKTDRQIQPSMGSANTHARQEDENLRLMGEWQGQLAQGTTTAKAAYFIDRLDYRDDGVLSLSKVKTYQTQLEHERALLPNLLLQIGTEAQLFRAQVGGYGGQKDENRYSAYGWLRYDAVRNLELSLNVRQAWVQGYNPPITPSLGAAWQVFENAVHAVTLKANVSRSYRVPTLNDRFWQPGGNANLQPERGWGYEGGLAHRFQKNKLNGTTEITFYALQVQDWIQWQPAPGGYSQPVNLSQVQGHGTEFSSNWQYQTRHPFTISGGLAYAYTISEQQLPNAQGQPQDRQLFYVPQHKVAGWAELGFRSWYLATDAAFTALRYSDNDNNRSLPAYFLANASLGKRFFYKTLQANVMAQVQNISNTVYQTMAYRAMPPRHFRVSLGLQWNRPANF